MSGARGRSRRAAELSSGQRPVILSIRDLGLVFQTERGLVTAVERFSLDLRRGEIHALVGESGSGKSVTVKSVLGLNPASAEYTSGNILYSGSDPDGVKHEPVDLLKLTERDLRRLRGRNISMIFQEPGRYLNPVMKVRQLLVETMVTHLPMTRREALERAYELLEQVELPDRDRVLGSYPHELSGGMKQRVMIAIALSCSPDIILADEPTTALDVTVQARILRLLKKISHSHNIAVLFISHDLAVVHEIAERVTVMYAGQRMETAPAAQLFRNPVHPYTRALLGAVPDIARRGEPLTVVRGNIPDGRSRPAGCLFHPRCPVVMDICRTEAPPCFTVEAVEAAANGEQANGRYVEEVTKAACFRAADQGER